MRVGLTGKNPDDILPFLRARGLIVTDRNPEVIICHGGDGSLLQAERNFPGIPKFPIRDERTAPRCSEHGYEAQLDAFCRHSLPHTVLSKVAAVFQGTRITGLNDVFIHNADIGSALRYRVRINGELYAHEIVGDGACLATVHGSTAYYRSITHSIFRVGLGLAFSNCTEEVSHLVLPEDARVQIEIVRGPGLLTADNSPDRLMLQDGDTVELFQDTEKAHIIGLAGFMCPKCRILRHPNKYPFKEMAAVIFPKKDD